MIQSMLATAIAAVICFAPNALAQGRGTGTLGIDMGYLMTPEHAKALKQLSIRGADDLQEIIRVGARTLDWVDLLQKDVPAEQREQIWRRADRIGREPTPESPLHYNPERILDQYRKALAQAPAAVRLALEGNSALPEAVPAGLTIQEVVQAAREVHTTYSRASRWLGLYGYRWALPKGSRDLRGWLKLKNERVALEDMTLRWASLTADERQRFVDDLSKSCPLSTQDSVEDCRASHARLVRTDTAGPAAQKWLHELLAGGEPAYNGKFGVIEAHRGVKTTDHPGGFHEIVMPTYGIEADVFGWIRDRVREAWHFEGVAGVDIEASATDVDGAVKVLWEKGALPHVNGIAGDTITMDSNTPKWLEHTQIVMRHEMGHVLGFNDCYTEFWDEDVDGFTYYVLDPTDRMCALSGDSLERHREALIAGYFRHGSQP